MQQVMTRKNAIWFAVATVTAWLTWQTYQQDADVAVVNSVRAVARPENTGRTAKRSASADKKLKPDGFYLEPRLKETQPYFNLFTVPVQRKQKSADHAEKPEAPIAPALPFKYMGAVTEENQTRLILDYQGEVLAVKAGDNLNVNYKLISINKVANSTELLFLYLPMNITQTMVVRDVSEH